MKPKGESSCMQFQLLAMVPDHPWPKKKQSQHQGPSTMQAPSLAKNSLVCLVRLLCDPLHLPPSRVFVYPAQLQLGKSGQQDDHHDPPFGTGKTGRVTAYNSKGKECVISEIWERVPCFQMYSPKNSQFAKYNKTKFSSKAANIILADLFSSSISFSFSLFLHNTGLCCKHFFPSSPHLPQPISHVRQIKAFFPQAYTNDCS